jgi:hypothetical protein
LIFLAGFDDAGSQEACRRPRGAWRRGKARPGVKTLLEKAGQHIVQHRPFAAEKMDAAADVEEEPVCSFSRHQRRVAVAPVGKTFEQAAIRGRFRLDDLDGRIHGAGIGDTHAALQPKRFSLLVERGDALGVVVPVADE